LSVNRPPLEITPAEFFGSWLPEELSRLQAASGAPLPEGTIGVTLEGDGGGAWTIECRGGEVQIAEGEAAAPDLGIRQSVQDWRTVVAGEGDGGFELVAAGGPSFDVLLAAGPVTEQLRQVRGALRLEVTGYRDRTFAIDLTFNGSAEPTATISVDAETFQAMRDGTIAPPQAFFSGKILIQGDQAFAMQLGMTMMSRGA
jgi:putative sterol carrier protein